MTIADFTFHRHTNTRKGQAARAFCPGDRKQNPQGGLNAALKKVRVERITENPDPL